MQTSAFRNAVKRKTHKERAQPRKLGLLEKKKDYRERARDYHKKEDAINVLRRKAEERNQDEFYHAMEHSKTVDGVHIARSTQANKYTQAELQLMKTQDINYVTLKAQVDAKKIERLRQSLHSIGEAAPRQHVVFVDQPGDLQTFDAARHFDTEPEHLDRAFNRPRRGTATTLAEEAVPDLPRKRGRLYQELQQRVERHSKLQQMVQDMQLEKAVMRPGRKRKQTVVVDGKKQTVFKWKQQRAR